MFLDRFYWSRTHWEDGTNPILRACANIAVGLSPTCFQVMEGLQMFVGSVIAILAGARPAMRALQKMAGTPRPDLVRREWMDAGAGRRA